MVLKMSLIVVIVKSKGILDLGGSEGWLTLL